MPSANFNGKRAQGFSLVELMVGMTLGLFTVVIIMQAFSVFENQKRTTTAASDAQENGLMALVQLEQDIRSAGTGLMDSAVFDCTNINSYHESGGTVSIPAPGVPTTAGAPMAPVVITDGGANGSDIIQMTAGTDFLGSIPVTLTDTMPQPSAELNVSRTMGFTEGQLVLVVQGNQCTVMQVTQVQNAALKIQHNPGGDPSYNPSGSFYTACGDPWPCFSSGAKILSFGSFVGNTYSIVANNLHLQNNVTGATPVDTDLVKDIVSLQAQYGVAAAGSQDVNAWVDATAATGFATLDPAKVKRIKAIRITVVARSAKREPVNVTTIAPVPELNDISLPGWRNYRYRTYTTIVPLRNVIWANL